MSQDCHSPAVSVVIPAYNAAWCIEETLDSVSKQTFSDYEVIVVNDGSTDDTGARVQEIMQGGGLTSARLIDQENKGQGAARNTGARAARAPFIAFLDSDDLWYPGKLAHAVELLRKTDLACGLVCHDEHVVRDGRIIGTNRYGPYVERMYERLLFGGCCLSPSAVVLRKEVFFSVGGFFELRTYDSSEDYDLWLRLAKVTKFQFSREVLGQYRLFPSSSSANVQRHLENQLNVLDDHFRQRDWGERTALRDTIRMRARRAVVYRQAARALIQRGQRQDARRHLARAIGLYPLSAKTWALGALLSAGVGV